MERIDYAIVVVAVVLSGVGARLTETAGERFIAIMAVLGLGAAAMAVNRAVVRQPKLTVYYRNPDLAGTPVVWTRRGDKNLDIEVVVRNDGRGIAEAVEGRFDRLGASDVFNESGNPATAVDVTVYPPRFVGRGRVLNPCSEWVIARLGWIRSGAVPTATGTWEASAKGMPTVRGVAEVTVLDEQPAGR